jgi:hypothetical protein
MWTASSARTLRRSVPQRDGEKIAESGELTPHNVASEPGAGARG